jgi:hypothetical protein
MSKIFSLVVLVALLYLVRQQFPQDTRDILEWADARVEELASRVHTRGDAPGDGPQDAIDSAARAVVETTESQPPDGRIEVATDSVFTADQESRDSGAGTPIRSEAHDEERLLQAIPEMLPSAQVVAAKPVRSDAERRIERDMARLRRDALAALAERMETLAIERAL